MSVFLWINIRNPDFKTLSLVLFYRRHLYMEDFNSLSHDIKFAYEFDKENISYLDLQVISSNGKLMTSLYGKHTDCLQYLHYKPSHPGH